MGMGSSFILVIFCPVFHQIYERKVRRIQHLQLSLVSLSSSKSKKHACIIIYICTVYIYSTVYVSLHGKVINMSTQKYEISKYIHPFKNTSQAWAQRCDWSNGLFMMPYLQVPYLRVPLLLQFFNDRKRFTALSSPQLQVSRGIFGWWNRGVLNGTSKKMELLFFAIFFCEKDDELT